MSVEYRVLVSPDLGLSAGALVEAWNGEPECAAKGKAQPDQGTKESFEFDLASAGLGALIVAASQLPKELMVELIKRALGRADARAAKKLAEETVVDIVPDPQTGLPLVVVRKRGDAK